MAADTPIQGRGQSTAIPRRLLSRLRDAMAEHGDVQERLNKIVQLIAADMVAEVCSIYVRRAGDVLELFATQGLKPSAVHATRLQIGEGIVGDIAHKSRPFALAEAQEHPNFAYRPETGEEIYHSMMGVPVLRGGRMIGVISVQNQTRRNYTDEEVETLQTVAMVLAEMIVGGELISEDELRPADGIGVKPLRLEGISLNGGIGIGVAVMHEASFHVEKLVAEDADFERKRLAQAFTQMHGSLDELLETDILSNGGEHRDVLEAYRMIAEDAGWFKRIEEAIDTGLTAEAALQKVQNEIRARLSNVQDPYLRERVHDLDDLGSRLLGYLMHGEGEIPLRELPENAILIARSMGPAQLLDYDHTRLRGLILEEGQPTSHVAIIARALEIPVVGQVRDILDRVEENDPVFVDSDHAQVFIRPGEDVLQAVEESFKSLEELKAKYAEIRDLPAVTTDGVPVSLSINAGLMVDMAHLEGSGADGVGLFRTEIPFMVRSQFPSVAEQAQLYGRVLDLAGGKPVVFRTLDIGGDKVLPYWKASEEDNPAMGWRAIRISLDRPVLLRLQLRSLIRAAAGRELRVMFPMVSEVAEFVAARKLLDKEIERERKIGGELPDTIKAGIMLEVPSLLFQLEQMLEQVDFISIGSNDLAQFLFARDRGNSRLTGRYDELSPSFLTMLKGVVQKCNDAGVKLGLCGEMAAKPLDAMALIGIGFRNISMAPSAIGQVKAMVRSMSYESLDSYLQTIEGNSESSLRKRLGNFARDHGVIT